MCLLFWDCFCVIQMGFVVVRVCVNSDAKKEKHKGHIHLSIQKQRYNSSNCDTCTGTYRHCLYDTACVCCGCASAEWCYLTNSCVFSSSQPKKHSDGCSTSWQVYVHCNGRVTAVELFLCSLIFSSRFFTVRVFHCLNYSVTLATWRPSPSLLLGF